MKRFAIFALVLALFAAPTLAVAGSDIVDSASQAVQDLPTEFGND